jgi:hypothetical protein
MDLVIAHAVTLYQHKGSQELLLAMTRAPPFTTSFRLPKPFCLIGYLWIILCEGVGGNKICFRSKSRVYIH